MFEMLNYTDNVNIILVVCVYKLNLKKIIGFKEHRLMDLIFYENPFFK